MGSPKVLGMKLHHYMYGIIVLALGLVFKSLLAYSVGFGFILDELPLALFPKNASWPEYESKKMFTGILVLLAILFLVRKAIVPAYF